MNVYGCLQCKNVVARRQEPSSQVCNAGRYHIWRKFGEEGSERYRCKRCDITVSLQMQPTTLGCPVATLHQWEKL